MKLPNKPPIWIDHQEPLKDLLSILLKQPLVAVDTEGDSLYSYFDKVCLIQFSIPEADYVVDPLNANVSILAPFFADESIQKVFHAAEYDFLSLKRDYGFTFANLFDTMLAARVLGWPRYGLGSLLKEYFDVKLNKRFQRYNWGQRPLSAEALSYARLDTHYLLPLRQIQLERLQAANRWREAQAAFARETQVEPTPKTFDPDDFWRVKGARDLSAAQQAILRELYILRDKIARRIDRPPFKVMNNSVMLKLARIQPHNRETLRQIKGVGKKLVRYNGSEILQAIRQGQQSPPPHYQRSANRPDEKTRTRYETLRHWRNNLAAERGVEPDVIINNDTLMSIARRNPKSLKALACLDELGDWQCETYGRTVIQILQDRVY